MAFRYELGALVGELRGLIPRGGGGGNGVLAGAKEVIQAVDDAAGAMDLDGESQQFDRESPFGQEGDADTAAGTGFDPWSAGEQRGKK